MWGRHHVLFFRHTEMWYKAEFLGLYFETDNSTIRRESHHQAVFSREWRMGVTEGGRGAGGHGPERRELFSVVLRLVSWTAPILSHLEYAISDNSVCVSELHGVQASTWLWWEDGVLSDCASDVCCVSYAHNRKYTIDIQKHFYSWWVIWGFPHLLTWSSYTYNPTHSYK